MNDTATWFLFHLQMKLKPRTSSNSSLVFYPLGFTTVKSLRNFMGVCFLSTVMAGEVVMLSLLSLEKKEGGKLWLDEDRVGRRD